MNFSQFEDGFLPAILTPPSGYRFAQVLLTTYTMSKRYLAEVLFQIYLAQNPGVDGRSVGDIEKRTILTNEFPAEKLSVYVGVIKESLANTRTAGLDEYLSGLAAKYLHPVSMASGSFFHPKLVLVKFLPDTPGTSALYRLSVSSKNLTYDNYFQAGVILEGTPNRGAPTPNGDKLYRFLSGFAAESDLSPAWQEVPSVDFQYNQTPAELFFSAPDGQPCHHDLKKRLSAECADANDPVRQFLFISDSVSLGFPSCCSLPVPPPAFRMVSNVKSWANCITGSGGIPRYCFVPDRPMYLHAKIYALQKQNDTALYIGSANCTPNALGNNYEAMVRLKVPNGIKPDELVRSQIKETTTCGFRQVTEGDLAGVAQDNAFEAFMKGWSAYATYDAATQTMTVRISMGSQPPPASVSYWFCPPNIGRKIELCPNGNGGVEPFTYPCKPSQLPTNGTACVLTGHTHTNPDGTASLDCFEIPFVPTSPFALPPCAENGAEYANNLYRGLLPRVRDAIPPATKPVVYTSGDSDEIRLAKYLSTVSSVPGAYKTIRSRVNSLLKKCPTLPDDETEVDVLGYNAALEACKAQLRAFDAMICEEEGAQ